MKLKALIFDVDGTIANTEFEGHFPACNDAFTRLGYPVRWTWQEYKSQLALTGTEARVQAALTIHCPDLTGPALNEAVNEVATLKRAIYLQEYAAQATLRAGIKALIAAAVAQQVKLAIVTLSHEAQVKVMLRHQMPEFADVFGPLLGKMAGPKHAPGSPLYTRCLADLGVDRDEVLVVEDSAGGTAAAVKAGLPVVVTYNDYTRHSHFPGARLITPTLASYSLEQLSFLCLER